MAYIGISRAPKGTFEWAMDQLWAGNEVRREEWPIEIEPRPTAPPGGFVNHARIWRLYSFGDSTGATICQGFNPGCCGADNDSWGNLGMDSGVYTPSIDDMVALDWQFVTEVTPDQIRERDANRVPRYPNEYVAAYNAKRPVRTWRVVMLTLLLAAAVLALWAARGRAADTPACLLLTVGDNPPKLVPVAIPFPSQGTCERAGAEMIDGKTVRNSVCLPLHIYDCRKVDPAAPPIPLPRPRPSRIAQNGPPEPLIRATGAIFRPRAGK